MRNIITVLCLLFATVSLNAQALLDKMPPSPTVASIINAAEITASKFTGSPNISIPIYQVGYHNMQVPISLSYDARGIKVDDVPGWVGTNWSLSAGGVISRSVNGLADDMAVSGYFLQYGPYATNGLLKVADLVAFDKGESDGHPDVFNFSFPGGSGKFMLDHNKNFHMFPHSKIDVRFISGTTVDSGFIITTLDGTEYTFDVTEITQVGAQENLPSDQYVSAWYLSKIESPIFPGKTIDFTYDASLQLDDIVKLKSYSAKRRYYTGGFYPSGSVVTSERFGSYQARRLNGISWGTGSIDFISTTSRTDLPDDKVLDEIRIKDNTNTVIKKYKFTYGYYGGSSQKLRLDQVQEFDAGSLSNPPYIFTYEGSALPAYNYTGQDFWGFNNGKGTNQDLLPKQVVDFQESYAQVNYNLHYNIGSADREPVEAELKKGLLQSITYPTGGISEFEMESHRFSNKLVDYFPTQFSSEMSCNIANIECKFINEYDYLDKTFPDERLTSDSEIVIAETGPEGSSNTVTKTFTIPAAQKVQFDIEIDQHSTTASYAKLEKNTENGWVEIFSFTSDTYKVESLLANTTYRLVGIPGGESGAHSDKVTLEAEWVVPTGVTDLYGPGLRVKQVNQREKAGGAVINVRKFEYTDTQGASSGILYSEPIFSYRKFVKENPNTTSEVITPIIVQRSGSAFQHFGDMLGYSRVVETVGINGENGQIVDIYNADPTAMLTALGPEYTLTYAPQQHPFAPSFYAYWQYGQLLESTVYRKRKVGQESGADYKKVQYTKNTFDFKAGTSIRGLSIGSVNVDDYTTHIDILGVDFYDEIHYKLAAVWEKLIKTEQTTYSNDEVGQTTVTEYTYETIPNHLQVKSQSVTGSDGRKTISEYTYPLDYGVDPIHPFIADLEEKNMHSSVIEELNILEYGGTREVLGGKITKYNGTSFQPEEIYTLKIGETAVLEGSLYKSTSYTGSNALMDSLYESRVQFTYRGGNLIEQQLTNGNAMSYVWGYDDQYPVAQVQNATYSDIEGLSEFPTNFDLNTGGLSPAQASALRNLPGALATTMVFKIGEGMQSQTSPNGLTTYYEYDTFKRLKYVKDKDNNILRKMEYKYQVNANTTNN